jgi:RNA polymerase sigma factor (sigma-70 family)
MTLESAYTAWAEDLVRYATVLVGSDDAPDVVANTFASLMLHGEQSWSRAREPRGFLFGAVANHARSQIRGARRRRTRRDRVTELERVARDGGSAVEVAVDERASTEVLDGLSTQQRAVIYLAYWEDLTAAEIAALLDVSQGTVRRQLARGRERLRKALA